MNTVVRSIVVTGGNRGIGRGVVEYFLAEGHKVAALSRGGGAPAGALGIACDIADPEQVDAAFAQAEEAHGLTQVLVANAGVVRDTLLIRMSPADWQQVIDTNLTGSFLTAKRAAKSMLRAKWGRIVFTGSVVGLHGSKGQANYAASKAGLIGMARSLARELGGRGITANVVAPGFIETDMTAGLPTEVVGGYLAQIPLAKLGQVADVAQTVAFLASERAGYITG
ncbi:MAG: SDR family oxidoreductase, partial [Propionibacteriaceae bacterium]|nr:SDR family oxidoreductase [Propionibacteriaceae bacterium]